MTLISAVVSYVRRTAAKDEDISGVRRDEDSEAARWQTREACVRGEHCTRTLW